MSENVCFNVIHGAFFRSANLRKALYSGYSYPLKAFIYKACRKMSGLNILIMSENVCFNDLACRKKSVLKYGAMSEKVVFDLFSA